MLVPMLHNRVKFFSKVCITEPNLDIASVNLYFALIRNDLKSYYVSKSLMGTCARMEPVGPRVLSIQSHVVSGYVGNKSATFPLQVLGFEVDAINSVQFSNHTGYGSWTGQVLQDTDLAQLIEGLQKNKLDQYTHLLTGYVGTAKFLTQTVKVLKHLRLRNPKLVFVCDPVMGDNGTMYVPEEFLPIYRDILIPLADIITPNQFEVELLTGQKIKTLNDAWKAVNIFHSWGTCTVVLSSTDLGDSEHLLGLASSIKNGKRESLSITIPRLPASFTGSGDLFAALFMAWMYHTKENTKLSLENTIASMHNVLQKTLEFSSSSGDFSEDLPGKMASMELRLVQSRKDIEFPDVRVRANVHEDVDAI